MKKKKLKTVPITMKMEDGSYCTLSHFTDGTSSFVSSKLGLVDGKPGIVEDETIFDTPTRKSDAPTKS